MQKNEIDGANEIRNFQKAKRAQIMDAFNKAEDPKAATLITKAEFDEQFPVASHERYSVSNLTSFREDLMKAEGMDNKDAAFQEATKGLQSFIVTDSGQKAIVFVRKKEKGE